jgi:hypothetical protein
VLLSPVQLALIDLAEFGGGVQCPTHTKVVFVISRNRRVIVWLLKEKIYICTASACVAGAASAPFFHIQVRAAAPVDIPFRWKDIGRRSNLARASHWWTTDHLGRTRNFEKDSLR